MKYVLTAAAASLIAAASIVVLAQAPRIDGRWEVKSEVSMPGMSMPPTTSTQCITKEEAADPQKQVPSQGRGGAANDSCKVSDYKIVGNKVTFNVKCDAPQPATMAVEMVYGVDKYDGTMKMDMARGGQPMSMTMKYAGKRLGDCTK